MRAWTLLVGCSLLFQACVILEEARPEPLPFPVPQPAPVPFPGSGLEGDPGTDVLWLVRVERGSANLAGSYELLIRDAAAVLGEAGLHVRTVALASLYTGELLWAEGPSAPAQVSPADALRFYAARAPTGPPTRCTTSGLAALGGDLSSAQVTYPASLIGGEVEAGPFRPFSLRPAAFFVGLIDSAARPLGHDAQGCSVGGRAPASYFGGEDPSEWLRLSSNQTLPRIQTRFALLGTAEGADDAEVHRRCLSQEGALPPGGLDALAASPLRFFEQFGAGLSGFHPGLAHPVDLCTALAGDWPSAVREIALPWVAELRPLGLPKDGSADGGALPDAGGGSPLNPGDGGGE